MAAPLRFQLHVAAELEKLPEVLGFLDQHLEEHDCSPKTMIELDIAVEEVFVNIANYAYPDRQGSADIELSFLHEESGKEFVLVTFMDQGIFFDPLAHRDPDITLSAEERQIGGLGIFMVKKSMDDVTYEYENGYNILTIKKYL